MTIFAFMIVLTNNTKSTSIVGKLVSISTNNPDAFEYTTPNSSRAIGVVIEAVSYRQKCKIATIGDTAKVLVQGNVTKDSIIRSAKSGDNVSLGSCKIAKASDAPYLKVGVALSPGSGLIDTILDLSFVNIVNNTSSIAEYADNAAAIAGGLKTGEFYRTGDALKVVH